MKLNKKNAKKILKYYLYNNKPKYKHSLRVATMCQILARKWHVPEEEAYIAGLLHDIGKSYHSSEMLDYCSRYNLKLYEYEVMCNPNSLHGIISAFLTEKHFNRMSDRDKLEKILRAIRRHVCGSGEMSDLDKIVYIADKIEPKKEDSVLAKDVIKGKISLNECILSIIDRKMDRAKKQDKIYNPFLDALRESILEESKNKKEQRKIVPKIDVTYNNGGLTDYYKETSSVDKTRNDVCIVL